MRRPPVPAAALGLALFLFAAACSDAASPFDDEIGAEAAIPSHVDFFSTKIFDFRYYISHNNLSATAEGGAPPAASNSREARAHWAAVGLKQGLRASPLFWSRAYLEHNVDVRDRYGEDNYPMAVVHYLLRGVNETWRETGGPSRAAIFDERVFRWQWYAQHNPLLHLHDEDAAKAHWRDHGIEAGLQASPDIHLKAYLAGNRDLRVRFGPTNYAAALAYFVDRGHTETWRPNGGQTCRFWGAWCQRALVEELGNAAAPAPPAYNSTGVAYDPTFQAPVPQGAGWDVTINGVDCAELDHKSEPRPSHSRVERAIHLHFRGIAGRVRPCSVYVRHFTDLQTRTQDSAPDSLSLRHWTFDGSAPDAVLRRPANISGTTYEGYTWFQPPAGQPAGAHGTADPAKARLAINYTLTGVMLPDPSVNAGEDQRKADREALPPRTLWSVQHHYEPAPGSPAGTGAPWGHDGGVTEMDEEERRALHAKLNTFFQPPHTPYKNVPLPKNYYVSSGVIPYYEQNAAERAAYQRSREQDAARALEEGLSESE